MRFALTLLLGSISSLAACSNGASGVANNPFQGSWACTVTEVLTFTTPPNSKPETFTTSPSLRIVADVTGNITSTEVTDAGPTCPLKLTTSGSSATIASGQACDAGGLSIKYTSGTASVNGSTLTASLSYSFAGTIAVPVDGGTTASEAVGGTGTSSYQCTKSSS